MIDSRKIEDLSPEAKAVCEKHIVLCTQAGVSLLVYSTYRDHECQNALYKIGRTLFPSGKKTAKVTNARGGQSWHNFRCAWDCVGLRFGKPVWKDSDPIWKTIVRCGIEAGALAGFYWKAIFRTHHISKYDRRLKETR